MKAIYDEILAYASTLLTGLDHQGAYVMATPGGPIEFEPIEEHESFGTYFRFELMTRELCHCPFAITLKEYRETKPSNRPGWVGEPRWKENVNDRLRDAIISINDFVQGKTSSVYGGGLAKSGSGLPE